jgi:hypothetical protein
MVVGLERRMSRDPMALLSMRRIAGPQIFVVVCIDVSPSIRSGQMTCAALVGPLDDELCIWESATSKKVEVRPQKWTGASGRPQETPNAMAYIYSTRII